MRQIRSNTAENDASRFLHIYMHPVGLSIQRRGSRVMIPIRIMQGKPNQELPVASAAEFPPRLSLQRESRAQSKKAEKQENSTKNGFVSSFSNGMNATQVTAQPRVGPSNRTLHDFVGHFSSAVVVGTGIFWNSVPNYQFPKSSLVGIQFGYWDWSVATCSTRLGGLNLFTRSRTILATQQQLKRQFAL